VAELDHLALIVGELATTREWYASVLGLEIEFDTGAVAGLKDDGDFSLIVAQETGPVSMCHLYFRVGDVEEAYREMSARGVVFRYPPQVND
jgi:catechol 2,3-dioxygenase-like lactoylglutathione lyase family enzyme